MTTNRSLMALAAACTLITACGSDTPPDNSAAPAAAAQAPVDQGLAVIDAGRIKTHLEFLADDARQGRMTGTPEYDEAADYVAEQFGAIGLEPGGEDGGWINVLYHMIDKSPFPHNIAFHIHFNDRIHL